LKGKLEEKDKLLRFQNSTKILDDILSSQRSPAIKTGLGFHESIEGESGSQSKTRTSNEKSVGFNPVQKLPAYEFLNKENKQCESITHKTHMHRDFPLDPGTGTTSLIFHYIPFNVRIHIYTRRSIQYHGPKSIASNTMDRKPSRPKNHVRKSCTEP